MAQVIISGWVVVINEFETGSDRNRVPFVQLKVGCPG